MAHPSLRPAKAAATTTEASLRAYLENNPSSAKAASKLACFLVDQLDESKRVEAVMLAKRAICLAPNKPAGYSALSIASDDHDERMAALLQTVTLWTPNCSMTCSAFAGSLVRLLLGPRQRPGYRRNTTPLSDDELKLYHKIQDALQPTGGDNVYLGRVHLKLGTFFRKLQPLEANRPRCTHHLKRSMELLPASHPLHKTAQFWLATTTEDSTIDRCPEDYVKSLYSHFAANFDELLVRKLQYETPTKLRQLVDTVVAADHTFQHACDLGCGTGLSGLAFRNIAQHLVGVDLSPEMIAKARDREVYDKLMVGDVVTALTLNQYDFIVACDVFCYIGELSAVFANVKRALREDGIFSFSTEHLRDDATRPFALHECARFAHQERYIRQLAVDHDFQVVTLEKAPIRKNGGKDVLGMLVLFKHNN
jgi:predicted TPR repeat methyltransferase